ncbi:cytochrome P450 [Sorangium cellulosum]|uniref:Cytochrome P450 n=1 Tax=Sorangium cellulosum TaxID=56 RepID=A0A2L0F1B0_SORCE|nr:cytochrome P450 [Sorangium cellulosum]AUX45259.1 cytochrome P450 [Sorangium cellulosum]
MSERSVASYLSDPAFYADPYPLYRALRERDPVMFTDLRGGAWLFTSYEDVAAGLKHERLSNARAGGFLKALPPDTHAELQPLAETLSRWMLFYDPPNHTRLRKLMGHTFAQTSLDTLRPRVESAVHELLDAVEPAGHMDVLKDFAFQLPLLVIVDMLGVPRDKRDEFIVWSGDIGQLLGGATPTLEVARRAQRSVAAMTEYLRERAALRRRAPADDILTLLLQAEADGDKLTEDELYAQCVLFLFAGHETTRNLIGNGLYALLRHPEELEKLRRDPSLIKTAVEELLRYDSPVQMLSRVVTDDIEYKGRRIKKGQMAMLFMAAANRDPAEFPDPDRLDVARKASRHLSFAWGPHLCLGAGLARMEAQIAFSALLQRMPDLRLADEPPQFVMNLVLRGLQSLEVRF